MNISYKREMKHNYLIIEQDNRETGYEVKMMVNNSIEGLLKFRIKKVDDRCYFCYEITSKQPLCRILETQSLDASQLRRMVISMSRILNRMEEYLLKEGQILLDPELIYVEPDSFQIGLCLFPGHQGDFPAELNGLLEYLLGKVDYQDKDCVVMAYGLYRESLKENYGMENLLEFLNNGEPLKTKDTVRQDIKTEIEVPKEVPITKQLPLNEKLPERKKKKTWYQLIREKLNFNLPKAGKISAKEEREKIKRKVRSEEQKPWQMVFEEERPEIRIEESEELSFNTVLLAEKKDENRIRKLMSLEPGIENISIAYYPFIIGKQESLVDYILNKDTVSRLHLRIDEADGGYRVTDLNSTNGTMVNGRLLENNESADIRSGDEIAIAGICFRFA